MYKEWKNQCPRKKGKKKIEEEKEAFYCSVHSQTQTRTNDERRIQLFSAQSYRRTRGQIWIDAFSYSVHSLADTHEDRYGPKHSAIQCTVRHKRGQTRTETLLYSAQSDTHEDRQGPKHSVIQCKFRHERGQVRTEVFSYSVHSQTHEDR